jgi:glycosyltransferase involved in cell wall biosynthesis
MRIGMIAPIWETTPPTGYGGIERVVDMLVRNLRLRGHEVALFTTGDSPGAEAGCWTEPQALRHLGFDTWSAQMAEAVHLANALARHRSFDLMHNHVGPMGNAFAEACGARVLSTLHGPFNAENLRYFLAYAHQPFVSISDSQREGCPDLSYMGTVYNGIETETYRCGRKQGYLLFLGRLSPEKGTHLAISAARRSGLPLVLAGKIDPFDQGYFEAEIAPQIDGDQVRFIGEVAGRAKREVLEGAIALLHLVQWSEPFGLAMVEAMASGTPVIAMRHGSIPEVVSPGRSGFIVESLDEAVEAIGRLEALSPEACRQEAVMRFDVSRMVDGYLDVYERLVAGPIVRTREAL